MIIHGIQLTGSLNISGSFNATASYAVTASYAENGGGGGFGNLIEYSDYDEMANGDSMALGDYAKVATNPFLRFLKLDVLVQFFSSWSTGSSTIGYWYLKNSSADSGSNLLNGTDTDMSYNGNESIFNGSTSKITVTDTAVLNPTGSFTISAWFKPTTFNDNYTTWIGKWNETGNLREYAFGEADSSRVTFFVSTDGVGSAAVYAARPVAGLWCNAVCVFRSGTKLDIYLNGILAGTSDISFVSVSNKTANLIFGTSRFGIADRFYSGSMKDVIFETRAWTTSEVLAYYSRTL